MSTFFKKLMLVITLILISSSSIFAYSNNELFNSLVANKQSYNSKLTQIEFLVLMGRLLYNTNDLAPPKIRSAFTKCTKMVRN